MEKFDNRQDMEKEMRRRGLTTNEKDKDIWSTNPPEFAGTWSYRNRPLPGKEAVTPVDADLVLKYSKGQ